MTDPVERWIRTDVRRLSAYHVPDAGDMVKLDAMENPYDWPAQMRADWLQVLANSPLNRYPDAGAAALKEQLRTTFAIPADTDLVLGNGSDELIQMIIMALAGDGHVVLTVEPTFVMYRMIALAARVDYVSVPLSNDGFELDGPAVLAAIERHQPAVVFLAYPNNPTGNLFDSAIIEQIIAASPGLVVIDEAYSPFTTASFMSELPRHDNVVVMRTVSKMGLAGLRLGYMAGPSTWLGQIEKLRLPYNIGVLTQLTALFALRHIEVLNRQTEQLCTDRQSLLAALQAMPDVQVWPSATNFLLFRVGDAAAIFAQLKRAGILVKNLHGSDPQLENCLRVTIGTPEENRLFLDALQAIL